MGRPVTRRIDYVLWTGTRKGKLGAESLMDGIANQFPDAEWVHGGGRGLDKQVDDYCKRTGRKCRPFRASWDQLGAAAGPIRNGVMVEFVSTGSAVCIAFPSGDNPKSGTRDCMRKAAAAGIDVVVFDLPDRDLK